MTSRITSAFVLAALVVTSADAQVSISGAGQGNWKRSSMSIKTLSEKVAAATANMKNVVADLKVDVVTPEGTALFVSPSIVVRLRDPKLYRVDYVVIQDIPFSAGMSFDGKSRKVRLDNEVRTLKSADPLPAAVKATGDRLVSLFDVDFPRLAFQGFTEGIDAWKPVLGGWVRGVGGYKPVVEERRMRYQGVDFFSYRVRAERVGAAAKKLGASTFEVVIDGKRFLPVTIRNVRTDVKGKKWLAQWAAIYRFNQKVGAKDINLG